MKEFDATAGKEGGWELGFCRVPKKLVVRGSQTVDGHRKANVWRRLRNEDWMAVLAEENCGVES